ncbi:hypothetical protein D3C80_2127400 [compost metagenome]
MNATSISPAVCATISVHGSLEISPHSGNSVAAMPSSEISAHTLRPQWSDNQPHTGRNAR